MSKSFWIALFVTVFAAIAFGTVHLATHRITASESGLPDSAVQKTETREEDTLAGNYLAARHASFATDNDKAAYYLGKARSFDPKNRDLVDLSAASDLLAGRFDMAIATAKMQPAALLTPLGDVLLFIDDARSGDWAKASARLDSLQAMGLQGVTLPFLKSWTRLALKKEVLPPESTLSLKNGFYQAFVNLQNALLYDQAGDADQAAQFYDLSLNDLQVVPYRFVTLAMQFYLRQQNEERAKEIYRRYQEANPENLAIQIQPYASVLNELKAYRNKAMIADPKEGIAEVMYTMATMLHGESVDREGLEYVRFALALRPGFAAAQMLLAEILEDGGKPEEAMALYEKIPPEDSLYRRAVVHRAFLLDKAGHEASAVDLLTKTMPAIAQPADIAMALADMERNHAHYDQAIAAYTQAIDLLGGQRPFQWVLYYTRGIAYAQANQWNKAESDMNEALKLHPNEPEVLNYLAYSWLMQNKNLDRATTMLEQAVAQEPNEGHIIDSLAWAYFLTHRYSRALQFAEQAVEIMPNDPLVNEHYGDILWAAGRHGEAHYQWERALFYKPEAAEISIIQQKMISGLPLAGAAQKPMATESAH